MVADSKAVRFFKGSYAIVPRAEYERLVKVVREAAEDAADRRTFRKAKRALAEGREIAIPEAFAMRLIAGESPALVYRNWRGMSQSEVAAVVGISRRRLSDIEAGRRDDTPELRCALARVLNVPVGAFEGFGLPK